MKATENQPGISATDLHALLYWFIQNVKPGTNGDFKTFDFPDIDITDKTSMVAFALDDEKSERQKSLALY